MNELIFYDRTTFGSHIDFSKNLENTFKLASLHQLYSFQFFLGSNRSYNRTQLKEDDLSRCLSLQKKTPMNVFTHSSLIYNLAGSIKNKSLAWNGNLEVDNMMNKIIDGLQYELLVTSNFTNTDVYKKSTGVVVHVGSWPDKKKGMDAIVQTINKIKFPKYSTLLLENTAGKGTTIGKTLDELKYIYDRVDQKDHVKFCLDTCHIFASGVYDIRTEIEVDRMFNEFESLFSLDKLGLIHFNDSFYKFNTQGDEHRTIGNGEIWTDNIGSCKYILEKIDRYKIPLVLETYVTDIKVIQQL